MLLSYITTEFNGTLTLDQLLRGPLSLSAREVREAKRLGLTVDGAPFFANQRIGAGRTPASRWRNTTNRWISPHPATSPFSTRTTRCWPCATAPLQVHLSSAPRGADTLEGRVQQYLHSGAHPFTGSTRRRRASCSSPSCPTRRRNSAADADRRFPQGISCVVCGVPAARERDRRADRPHRPDSFTRAVLPGGQRAVTRYRVEHICGDVRSSAFSRHRADASARVHAAHIGHPMLGDTRYCTAESTRWPKNTARRIISSARSGSR
ncbi:MAG: hypothetical protein ACLS7Z_05145 [Christensenellales bacterium]